MEQPIPDEIRIAAEETQRRIAEFNKTGKLPEAPIDAQKIRSDIEAVRKFNTPANTRTEQGRSSVLSPEQDIAAEESVIIDDEETRQAMQSSEEANLIARAALHNDMIGQSETARVRQAKEAEKRAAFLQEVALESDKQRAEQAAGQIKEIEEERELGNNIVSAAKQLDAERAEAQKKERMEEDLTVRYGDLQLELMDAEEKGDAERAAALKSELEAVSHNLELIKQEMRGVRQEVPAELMAAKPGEITRSVDSAVEDMTRFSEASDEEIGADVDVAFEQIIEDEDFTEDEKAWFEGGEKTEWDNKKVIEQLLAEKEKARKELFEMTKPNEPEFVQAALEKPKTKLTWKELKMVAKHAAKWATNSEYRKTWRALETANEALADERDVFEALKPRDLDKEYGRKLSDKEKAQILAHEAVVSAEKRALRRAVMRSRVMEEPKTPKTMLR